MGRHREADLSRLTRTSIRERASKVDVAAQARPPARPDSFADLWDGLPDLLAGRDLRSVAVAIVRAQAAGRPVVWMFGAHVVKAGLAPLVVRLVREDLATLIAVNGAFAIHDALWGATSEEVGSELPRGRFGMARETARLLAQAAEEGVQRKEGLGEALGRLLAARRPEWKSESILGVCHEAGLPVTVHVALGTDIVHQHPEFSGAATGETSARDFRILAGHLADLREAVVVNVGSAVVLPEVFLKACSVAINLGASPEGLITANFDFLMQYRPLQNVVRRPPGAGGAGYALVGHHELLLPLLFQGLLLERGRLQAAAQGSQAGPASGVGH